MACLCCWTCCLSESLSPQCSLGCCSAAGAARFEVVRGVPFAAAAAMQQLCWISWLGSAGPGLPAAAAASSRVACEYITACPSSAAATADPKPSRLTLGSRLILRPWTCKRHQRLQSVRVKHQEDSFWPAASHTYARAVTCSAPIWLLSIGVGLQISLNCFHYSCG